MKHTIMAIAIIFFVTGPLSVLAEDLVVSDIPSEPVKPDTDVTVKENPETLAPMPGMGIKRKGNCPHGKGHGGMKHGGGQHGKGKHDKHAQVVQRLDMIEARMAKIEAMLEALMRR